MQRYPYAKHKLTHRDIVAGIKALKSGVLSRGKQTSRLEEELCKQTGASFAVAVSSGTAALHCAYLAVADLLVDQEERSPLFSHKTPFITSPITFASAVTTGILSGFHPVFSDVQTGQPHLLRDNVQNLLKSAVVKPKVLVATAYAGHSYNQPEIKQVAEQHNLITIADHAHSLGGEIKTELGRMFMPNAQFADMTTVSFQATKAITGAGEGGAILTNSEFWYKKLLAIRSNGMVYENLQRNNEGPHYHEMQFPGLNYRITEFQSALLLSQLKRLKESIEQRNIVATWYFEFLLDVENIRLPVVTDTLPAWHLFVVRVKNRNFVATELRRKGIGTQVHYLPVYKHPWYEKNGFSKSVRCENAEAFYAEALSLPMYVGLRKRDVQFICETLKGILEKAF